MTKNFLLFCLIRDITNTGSKKRTEVAMNNLKEILSLAKMLTKTMGPFYRIVVADTEKYLFVEKAMDDEVCVGTPIDNNEKFFLDNEDMKKLPFVVNYKSLSGNMRKLRSSTYFFKDESGDIQYMLTISLVVDEFIRIRNAMDVFTNGAQLEQELSVSIDSQPMLNIPIGTLITDVLNEGCKRFRTTIGRMNKEEKKSILREMHSRGVFLVKGAVTEVATQLDYSEATIYRFIKTMENE